MKAEKCLMRRRAEITAQNGFWREILFLFVKIIKYIGKLEAFSILYHILQYLSDRGKGETIQKSWEKFDIVYKKGIYGGKNRQEKREKRGKPKI